MLAPGVVPINVAEVSADFRGHVPAVERGGGELEAAAIERHIGHRRKRVPLQSQLLEPGKPQK